MAACTGCRTELAANAKFCANCGAPVPQAAPTDPLIGQSLGQYKVVRALASGGMGSVYIAEQTNLGRKVCIKTLLPGLASDPTMVARFEREARAVSALRHPNITQVFDFGKWNQHLYLVMELVEGQSLRQLIEQLAPLPAERACALVAQILSALEEAHAAGIVHRDLKPENVLVAKLRDGSEVLKVVDFGIAKLMDEKENGGKNLTGTGLVCGTPGYMAPEQISGDVLDARCDVYAVGIILFELLTGKPPFNFTNITELIRAHLTMDPPAPSQTTSLAIAPEIDEVVLKALAREKDFRLPSALEFKRALDRAKPGAAPRPHTGGGQPAVTQLTGQVVRCPSCQAVNPKGQKFCGECGGNLPLTPVSNAEMDALKKVLPNSLVGHLGALPDSLAAEKRNVTVVFGDISGFTSMSEKLPPEQVREIMNRCFDGMVEAVSRYDGTVDKFIGDAIMVLFGAPKAHEDDPERAVRCALEMQAWLTEVNKTLAQPLKMRIGINTGEVVAGGVGGSKRMDYTVMGDAVNTAQRIESHAAPGKILVSAAVKRLTDTAIAYRSMAAITVKGKTEPVAVFEVESLKGQSATVEPMVGRRDERLRLETLFKQVKQGKPGGVVFIGEPGMGKTRLLEAARELAVSQGLLVASARTRRMVAPGHLELAREALFSVVGGLPPSMAAANKQLALLSEKGVNGGDIERLKYLFAAGTQITGFDGDEARRLDLSVVVQTWLSIARRAKGLCILLDDVHLADGSSLEYFDELTVRAAGVPLAIVAAARPGESDRVLKRVPRVPLPPLSALEVRQLASQQLAGAELPDSIAEAVVSRGDGNPFVVKELLRTLIDNGALELRGGRWQSSASFHAMKLPDSVSQLLVARLDSLSPAARQVLRYGAVHGRIFAADLVTQAVDGAPHEVTLSLNECRHKGFLVDLEQPQGCWMFRQEMVLQSVLKGINATDMQHIHTRLAEALENGASSGDAHPSEAMARHYLAAGKQRKAATYFAVMAERLASRSAVAASIEAYTKAIELTKTEGAWVQVLALVCKLAPVQSVVAPADALKLINDVLAALPGTVDNRARAEVTKHLGLLQLKLGQLVEAESTFSLALDQYGAEASSETRASIEIDLAAVREQRGNYPGATFALMEALKKLAGARLNDKDLMWRCLNQLGRVHLRVNEVQKAKDFFENARAQAERVKSVVGETRAITNLAGALAAGGDVAGAEQLFIKALELAQKAGDRIDVARIEFNVGRLLLTKGQRDEAARRLQTALELSTQVAWREGVAAATQALEGLRAQGQRATSVLSKA